MNPYLRPALLFVALIGCGLVVTLCGYLVVGPPQTEIASALSLKEEVVGLPMRLMIPAINVDAPIEHVGLTADGAMDTPTGPAATAWFDLGPLPGDVGTAVIDGHFGWENGVPAVFDDLHTLTKGDAVYVEDANGALTTFIVREITTYAEDATAPGVFSSNDGKAHLNLITCGGIWDGAEQRYSDRIVVFTDKE